MTTVLLDTNVVVWWSLESDRLSRSASQALAQADELAIAAITWWELAWLVRHDRIRPAIPLNAWLYGLEVELRTARITPAVAATAVALPESFPRDPADRLIYATAVEYGWNLISKDEQIRAHSSSGPTVIW